MANLVIQKAVALLFLIVVGYLLKRKFQDPSSISTIRNFILNVALPATIFLSTIEINTQLDLLLLPSFALAVNIYLMLVGFLLAYLLLKKSESAKRRALILLFPSLAPGLTVYPFIEQFLGKQGLAWAALADTGNKLFVLIGLYALAIYWYRKASDQIDSQVKIPWKSIALFLLGEPVNIAIIVGLALAISHLSSNSLPLALSDAIQKLAACATPLILFYVGISLNLKSFQFGTLLMILLARAGAGFLFSAAAIAVLHPPTLEATILFIALPQASCSLWPLLHANRINQQDSSLSSNNQFREKPNFFDTNFATSLLALSFPFSIFVLLIVFSSGTAFTSPVQLGSAGVILLAAFGALFGYQQLPVQLQSPVRVKISLRSPFSLKSEATKIHFLNQQAIEFFQAAQPSKANPIHEAASKEQQLKTLILILHKYLPSKAKNQEINLQIQHSLKGETLIILGQHKGDKFVNLNQVFCDFEREIQLLNFNFFNHVRLYFRIYGQKQPYISYSLNPDTEISKSIAPNSVGA